MSGAQTLKATSTSLRRLTDASMDDAPKAKHIDSIKSVVNNLVDEANKSKDKKIGIKLSENADVEFVEFDVQVPDPWAELTPLTPWTGTIKYMKHPDGTVEIRVSVSGGTTNDTIVSLPDQLVPYDDVVMPCADPSTNQYSSVGFLQSGDMHCAFDGGSGQICGIFRYLSEDHTPIALSCWPKTIGTKLQSVSGLSLIDVRDADNTKPKPSGCCWQPAWEVVSSNGSQSVRLLNIAGLPYNRKSHVRLILFGG